MMFSRFLTKSFLYMVAMQLFSFCENTSLIGAENNGENNDLVFRTWGNLRTTKPWLHFTWFLQQKEKECGSVVYGGHLYRESWAGWGQCLLYLLWERISKYEISMNLCVFSVHWFRFSDPISKEKLKTSQLDSSSQFLL